MQEQQNVRHLKENKDEKCDVYAMIHTFHKVVKSSMFAFWVFIFEKVVWISPMLWKENDWSLISYSVTVTSYLGRSCADGSKWKPKGNIGSSCACPFVGLIKHIPQILIRHNASDNADSISSPSFGILSIFVFLFDNSDYCSKLTLLRSVNVTTSIR